MFDAQKAQKPPVKAAWVAFKRGKHSPGTKSSSFQLFPTKEGSTAALLFNQWPDLKLVSSLVSNLPPPLQLTKKKHVRFSFVMRRHFILLENFISVTIHLYRWWSSRQWQTPKSLQTNIKLVQLEPFDKIITIEQEQGCPLPRGGMLSFLHEELM